MSKPVSFTQERALATISSYIRTDARKQKVFVVNDLILHVFGSMFIPRDKGLRVFVHKDQMFVVAVQTKPGTTALMKIEVVGILPANLSLVYRFAKGGYRYLNMTSFRVSCSQVDGVVITRTAMTPNVLSVIEDMMLDKPYMKHLALTLQKSSTETRTLIQMAQVTSEELVAAIESSRRVRADTTRSTFQVGAEKICRDTSYIRAAGSSFTTGKYEVGYVTLANGKLWPVHQLIKYEVAPPELDDEFQTEASL